MGDERKVSPPAIILFYAGFAGERAQASDYKNAAQRTVKAVTRYLIPVTRHMLSPQMKQGSHACFFTQKEAAAKCECISLRSLCISTLFRSENTIACIPEPRDDVAVFV